MYFHAVLLVIFTRQLFNGLFSRTTWVRLHEKG